MKSLSWEDFNRFMFESKEFPATWDITIKSRYHVGEDDPKPEVVHLMDWCERSLVSPWTFRPPTSSNAPWFTLSNAEDVIRFRVFWHHIILMIDESDPRKKPFKAVRIYVSKYVRD